MDGSAGALALIDLLYVAPVAKVVVSYRSITNARIKLASVPECDLHLTAAISGLTVRHKWCRIKARK